MEKHLLKECCLQGPTSFFQEVYFIFKQPKSINMEQNESTLFSLNVDPQSKSFLSEASKWGRFLAIVGFIVCAIVIVVGIFMAVKVNEVNSMYREFGGMRGRDAENLGIIMAVAYILIAVIYFFPCLYLLRFSDHMKAALNSDNQDNLRTAFQNLKSMFKFVGVLTIIVLAIYALLFIVGLGASL